MLPISRNQSPGIHRAGGHFYMADGAEEEDPANFPDHNIVQVIRNVMIVTLHGSFARTFYSEPISEIITKLSQKYNFLLVITY